jgi:hypothetical protein
MKTEIDAGKDSDLLCVALATAISLAFFFLQARYLHEAAIPATDEGVYAEAGRMMWSGLVPHTDFGFWHMPLLPLLIGLGLKVLPGIYAVRLVFLFGHCFAAVPLALFLRRMSPTVVAPIVAAFFYLSFHEMVHHDFRFIAIRQAANDLFILFIYFGSCGRKWQLSYAAQVVLASASALLFLPSLPNFFLASMLLIWRRESGTLRHELVRYAWIVGVAVGVALLYLLAMPHAFQQIVLDQMERPSESRLLRVPALLTEVLLEKDIPFCGMSVISLIVALSFRALRPLAIAMLGIILMALFLSSNFYPHYLSIAGPAFATGIFCLVVLVQRAAETLGRWSVLGVAIPISLLCTVHVSLVMHSLLGEWLLNRQPSYRVLVEAIANARGPVLTHLPIYAVDAGVPVVHEFSDAYMRPPVWKARYTEEQLLAMENQASSILIEGWMRGAVSESTIERWLAQYPHAAENEWGIVLYTRRAQRP